MTAFYAPVAAGVVMLVLAAWLLHVQARQAAARAFVLVLLARALALAALTAMVVAPSVEGAWIASVAYSALCLATICAVVYFTGVYPARRRWLGRGPGIPLAMLGVLAALEVALVLHPELVRSPDLLVGTGSEGVFRWIMATPQGPFGITPTLLDLVMALPAFALARDYLAAPRGRRRSTLLLVSLGFFAPAACSCLMAGAFVQIRSVFPRPESPSIFNFAEMGVFVAWFVVLAAMLVYLGVHALRSADRLTTREAGLFAAVLVFSTALGATTGGLAEPPDAARAVFVMLAFWSTLGAALVTYGVLRYSLFDIDMRLKASFRRGTVAAVFVAVYFLVSEAAAELFAGVWGSAYLGIAAAALLLIALHPIRGFAERLVERLMPGTKPLLDLGRDEALDFYREHVDLMWMDGHLSAKDRLVLANLRTRLGLDLEAAEAIELEVLGGRAGAVSAGT